jgi:hypothetical protein
MGPLVVMKQFQLALTITTSLCLWNLRAEAQGKLDPKAPSLPEDAADAPADDAPEWQTQIDQLKQQIARSEEARRQEASRLSINGYVDFGFFAPNGNHGIGWIRDAGNVAFPQYAPYSWVFLGDILGSPINSRGEAADLGMAPGVDRFDSVHSSGAPGFIANEVNVRLGYQLADKALLRTSVNFVPRTGKQDFSLGDFFDVDTAELEYVVTDSGNTSIFVGKTMPVFGIEYKDRKADKRFGVTPSLIDRYTSGSQLGLKFRSKLLSDWIIVAGAISNNSSTVEQFHFYSEIDQNSGKTFSGRLALSIPIGDFIRGLPGHRLELGGSGEWGPQDRATDNKGNTWFVGADLQYFGGNFLLKAQWIRGHSDGEGDDIWALKLRNSGFAEIDWQFLPFLGAYGRADQRDAIVLLGTTRAYITKVRRYTGGLRVVFNPHIVLKAEYYHNQEYGGVPSFDNDMFTSSLVLSF